MGYFSLQPVFHDLCKKGNVRYYPVSAIVQLKDYLLLTGMSRPCGGGSRFLLLLSGWSFSRMSNAI